MEIARAAQKEREELQTLYRGGERRGAARVEEQLSQWRGARAELARLRASLTTAHGGRGCLKCRDGTHRWALRARARAGSACPSSNKVLPVTRVRCCCSSCVMTRLTTWLPRGARCIACCSAQLWDSARARRACACASAHARPCHEILPRRACSWTECPRMAAVWEEGEHGSQKGNRWKAWASEQHAKGCCLFCGDPTHL